MRLWTTRCLIHGGSAMDEQPKLTRAWLLAALVLKGADQGAGEGDTLGTHFVSHQRMGGSEMARRRRRLNVLGGGASVRVGERKRQLGAGHVWWRGAGRCGSRRRQRLGLAEGRRKGRSGAGGGGLAGLLGWLENKWAR
jgi:hypothetical protein